MLTSHVDILSIAREHQFAVPAFNISDYAMFNGVLDASEAAQAPLLVAIHPDELSHIGGDLVAAIASRAHAATIPVGIHLDHGTTLEHALLGIRLGFTSVMIDGSMLPFEENLDITRRVVELAHAVGVRVEGELGTIGKLDEQSEDGVSEITYTDPEDVVQFVGETGVDSLAVAIGTSHGLYPAGVKPELKLDLLERIAAAVSVPLVLHGGSGNPDDEIAKSAALGISKINISSDIKTAYHNKMREVLADASLREPNTIQPPCIEAMQSVVNHKIRLFNADGKASLC